MHIEYSDFDTPILCARLHMHPNIWFHRFLRFVENKIPKILTRDTSCSPKERALLRVLWKCYQTYNRGNSISTGWKSKPTHTHRHTFAVSFIESWLRHIKFQTDFNLILCASGDDKGPGPWLRHGHGRVCYGHNAVSPYFSVSRQITNKGVFATPSSTARRGGVFVAAVNKAICLLCCLRLVL